MEPNLTYVYPHTRIQSLVSILRTTVHHAFPVVTENRGNEKEFMKGNQLISNNIKFKVKKRKKKKGPKGKTSEEGPSALTLILRNTASEAVVDADSVSLGKVCSTLLCDPVGSRKQVGGPLKVSRLGVNYLPYASIWEGSRVADTNGL